MSMARGALSVAVLAASMVASRPCGADDKSACLAATEHGQFLRVAHKLVEAREEFLRCARAECPPLVQQDCASWLAEVDKSLPTLVITAKDATGADLVDVNVTVDGEPLVGRLDGAALAVNPGDHAFHFALADGRTLDKQYIVLQGQKDQRLAVAWAPTPARTGPPPVVAPVAAAPARAADPAGHRRRVLGVVVASAGLAGLAVGALFGGVALSSWSSVNSVCPSHRDCPSQALSDHDNAVTFSTVSDVGFIAGGVLVASGLALYLTAPASREHTQSIRVDLVPGGAWLRGTF
jgi:hypothetical protein